jgi:nucleoside-diphosphate-sugar epimerase
MMQKALVMGGSYFVGKKIVDTLLESGKYQVFTLNRGTRPNHDDRITNLISDRNDAEHMKATLAGYSFDAVIDVSCYNPAQAGILTDSLDLSSLRTFVFISSAAVYDVELAPIPFQETAPLGGNKYWTSYGQNKIDTEAFYTKCFQGTKTGLVILRPPYIYGENNYAQRESFIFDHILNDKPILLPNPDTKLQFIYTGDLADIILSLLKKPSEQVDIFNVGNREPVTSREWIALCEKITGKDAKIIVYDYKKYNRNPASFFPFFDYDSVLDVTRIGKIAPVETSLEKGLRIAFAWYCENRESIVIRERTAQNERDILQELGM